MSASFNFRQSSRLQSRLNGHYRHRPIVAWGLTEWLLQRATFLKNTVQALKYPSADAVTLYMPGFKAIN